MEQPTDTIKQVYGPPTADAAEPCDEYCDTACMHHVPSVRWPFSFGSQLNIHPVDTADGRLVVSLQLSDDAIANGQVYRQVQPEQLVDFAQQLLALVGAGWKLVPAVNPAATGG